MNKKRTTSERNNFAKLFKLLLLFLLFTASIFQARASFTWKEFIQKEDVTITYEKSDRQVKVKFPWVFTEGYFDWMRTLDIYCYFKDNSNVQQSINLAYLEFPTYNTVNKTLKLCTSFPTNKNGNVLTDYRYYTLVGYRGCTATLTEGTPAKSSAGQNAKWAVITIQLPVSFDGYGKYVDFKVKGWWAPDDFKKNNEGPKVSGGQNFKTDSYGELLYEFDYLAINIPELVAKPSITMLTEQNNYDLKLDFSGIEGTEQWLDFNINIKRPICGNNMLAGSDLSGNNWRFWLKLPTGAKTHVFNWKNFVDDNFSQGFKLKNKMTAYILHSDAEKKRFLYALFLESETRFQVSNQPKIGNEVYKRYSDERIFNPNLAQPQYLKVERINTDKHIKLTWQAPGQPGFSNNSGVTFIVERSEDNKNFTRVNSATIGYPASSVTANTVLTNFTFTDTDNNLQEGKTYYYRISRPLSGKSGWDAGATAANIKLDYGNMKPIGFKTSIKASTQLPVLEWTLPTASEGSFSKVEIYRKVKEEKNWSMLASVNKGAAVLIRTVSGQNAKFLYNDETSVIAYCTEYEYKVKLFHTNLSFETGTESVHTDANNVAAYSYNASKGLYSDKVVVNIEIGNPDFFIERRIYGPGDNEWVKVFSEPAFNESRFRTWADYNASPGTVYEYRVGVNAYCSSLGASDNFVYTEPFVGFRRSTATITGRVAFEGGTSVEGVRVIAKPANAKVGQSAAALYYSTAVDNLNAKVVTKTNVFDTRQNFTVQAWAYMETSTQAATLLRKRAGTTNTLNITFALTPTARQVNVSINGVATPFVFSDNRPVESKGDDKWYNIGVVRFPNTLLVYIDGVLIGNQTVTIPTITNAVANADTTLYFLGSGKAGLDDVRFWNRALTEKEMVNTFNRILSGDENGLAGYWKFDEKMPNEFYDYSFTQSVANERHGTLSSDYTHITDNLPDETQLAYCGITDEFGNYIISGIPYKNDGVTYRIIPAFGTHSFNPIEEILFIDPSSYVHNRVNFTDVSSFTVSGQALYKNTLFPVEGANIYIDGTMAIKNGQPIATNSFGEFNVEVPIGQHFIEVKKNGHVFVNGGRFPVGNGTYLFNKPLVISDVFYDSTLVRVAGRVAGGPIEGAKDLGFSLSNNNIGKSMLTLQARYKEIFALTPEPSASVTDTVQHARPVFIESTGKSVMPYTRVIRKAAGSGEYEIEIHPDPETGEFFADLIPEDFNVTYVRAGTNSNGTAFELPVEQRFPLELNDKAGVIAHLFHNLSDSITVYDQLGNPKKEAKRDSVAYGGVAQKYIRRNPAEIGVINWATDRIADDLFGEKTVSSFNPLTNKEQSIQVIDPATKKYLMNNLPVFKMGNFYSMKISVFEEYVNRDNTGAPVVDRAPVIDGLLIIDNELSQNPREYLELDSLGSVIYEFFGAIPSLTILESDGKLNHTKTFNITAATGDKGIFKTNWRPENDPLRAYLLGANVTGSNFTTREPKRLLTVLRDPPGSTSSASYQSAITFTEEDSFEHFHGFDFNIATDFVVGTKMSVGVGLVTESLDNENSLGVGFSTTEQWKKGNKTVTKTSLTQKYSTSEMPNYVGAMADVLVGYARNMVFSEATSLNIYQENALPSGILSGTTIPFGNGYCLAQRSAIDMSPEFDTHFLYTVAGIENKIIPDLKKLRNEMLYDTITIQGVAPNPNLLNKNVYVSTVAKSDVNFGEPEYYYIKYPDNFVFSHNTDSVKLFNDDITGWKGVMAENEKDKIESFQTASGTNISFEAGSSYEREMMTDTTKTVSRSFEFTADISGRLNLILKIKGIGIKINSELKQVNGGTESSSTEDSEAVTYSYKLSDDNPGDFISVDVFPSSKNWGPVFRTRGGQTSCPYEDAVYAKYYEPAQNYLLSQATAQRHKPKISAEPSVRSHVPGNKAAIFTLTLENESETNTDVYYKVMVDETTNPNGAILAIDGLPIGSEREIFVPAGSKTIKTLSLNRTREDVFDYKDIEISLNAPCFLLTYDYFQTPSSSVLISAYFTPACGDINFQSPVNNFIVNQAQMDTTATSKGIKGILPITIGDFDINNSVLDNITLYYKAETESEDKWKMMKQWAKTPAGSQEALNTATLVYNWDLQDVPNRIYNLKAVASAAAQGAGAIPTSETDILTIIKDDKSPVQFGKTQPASGILTAEEDIAIAFDKEIEQSKILPSLNGNIQVTAQLPGYSMQHGAGVSFNGAGNYVTVPDKVNLNHCFTADFWFKRDRMKTREVMFSHGSDTTNFIELGFTADDKIFVKTAKGEYSSSGKYTYVTAAAVQDDWAHIGMAFDGVKMQVYVNSDIYISKNDITPYINQAILTLGRNIDGKEYFRGKIHELRVWNKFVDVDEKAWYFNKTLTGKEPGLYSNWEINEAFGNIAKDKVRGRNAVISADWFVEPAGKAKALNGSSQYISIPMKNIKSEDDYTVEMWFKGGAQTLPATLIATGDGMTGDNKRNQFNLYFNSAKKLTFDANEISTIISDENYLDNRWHHVAVAVNHTGNAIFYVDGVAKAYRPGSTLGGGTGAAFSLGACKTTASTSGWFKGEIDEFRYWRMYRNEELIKMHITSKLQGNEAGLTAYYPFETEVSNAIVESNFNFAQDFANETAAVNGATTVEGTAIKTATTIENIPFSWALNRDKIIISLTERDDYVSRMENTVLTISVKDLYDKYGNPSAAYSWTAYVDRNQLRWSESELNYTIEAGESLTFEAFVSNMSGTVQDFTITQIPSWLNISATSGKIQPRSTMKIVFTVSKELGTGDYEQQIYLNGRLLSDRLKVRVKVASQKPEWTVNPKDFPNSMSIIGQLKIGGNFSTDTEDILVAFNGDQCVGLASPRYVKEYDAYYVFMNVYGTTDGNLIFKIWHAGTGLIYPQIAVSEAISFSPDILYGSIVSPVIFNAEINIIQQDINLSNAWNWISLNVVSPNPTDFQTILRSVGSTAEMIKYINFYRQIDTLGVWQGELADVVVGKMYKMKMQSAATLSVPGTLANSALHPITLAKGWSWIGYVPQHATPVNEALAGLNATEGDLIKGQNSFATYTPINGWIGTLEYLQPGKGYLFQSAKATTFNYPAVTTGRHYAPAMFRSDRTDYHWSFDESSYPSNMTMTAVLYIDGIECQTADYEIGVFDQNGVCRGNSMLRKDISGGRCFAFLTIMGDQTGDKLTLKVYHAKSDMIYDIHQQITFSADNILGNIERPYRLDIGEFTGININSSDRIAVYPNPVKDILFIDTQGLAINKIQLIDISGIIIEVIPPYSESVNLSALSAGVYFLRIETERGEIVTHRIIKL